MAKAEKHVVYWTEHSRPDKQKKRTFGTLSAAESFRKERARDPKVVSGSAYVVSSNPKFPRR